jgi:hypothetical protein
VTWQCVEWQECRFFNVRNAVVRISPFLLYLRPHHADRCRHPAGVFFENNIQLASHTNQGGNNDGGQDVDRSQGARGGSSEQHAKGGRQSRKNG